VIVCCYQIVDVDTGKTLGPGEEGEICVRGVSVSTGYVNRPEETANMFLPDGWVRTGEKSLPLSRCFFVFIVSFI